MQQGPAFEFYCPQTRFYIIVVAMDMYSMLFPVSGVTTPVLLPPLVALVVSAFTIRTGKLG
jgi:uncharacterized membrane protein